MEATSTQADDILNDIKAEAEATAEKAAPATKKRRTSLAKAKEPKPEATGVDKRQLVQDMRATDGTSLPTERAGCVVWWSAHDISVRPWALFDAIEAADEARDVDDDGQPVGPSFVDLVPTPSTVPNAARRAMSRRQQGLPEGLRWHDVGDDDKATPPATIIALAEEDADPSAETFFSRARWTVRFAHDGVVSHPPFDTLDDGERAALGSLLERYNRERSSLTASDIGPILVNIIVGRLGGIRVKSGGGVYFVPSPHDATIDRLARAFALAGVYLKRTPVALVDVGQFKGDVEDSLIEDATKILDEANDAVKRLEAAHAGEKGKGKPRFDATQRRLDEIDGLRRRARAYSTLLGALTANVEQALKKAERATSVVLNDLTEGIVPVLGDEGGAA